MTTADEKIAAYQALVEDEFTVLRITTVNHKPHPFMIGPRHVVYASKHCGGMLDEHALRQHPCVMPVSQRPRRLCGLPYDEHHYDKVGFLKLRQDLRPSQVRRALLRLAEKNIACGDRIDGFTFVETEDKFRIIAELEGVEVGDTIIRRFIDDDKDSPTVSLAVTAVEDDRVVCGSWTFDMKTGAEIDEQLGWGPHPQYTHTGSVAQWDTQTADRNALQ